MPRPVAGRRRAVKHFPYSLSFPSAAAQKMTLAGTDVYNFERTQPFTIGMWLNPIRDITNTIHIFADYLNSGSFRGRLIRIDSSLLRFWLINTLTTNQLQVNYTPMALNKGAWLFMSYTGNSLASGVSCWFDRTLQTQISSLQTLTGTIANAGTSTVWGGWPTVSFPYGGLMAGMFVCNYAFNQTMVDDFFYDGIFSGGTPIDYYPLTEGSGTSVASTGSGAHTGTLTASVTWNSSATPGKARTTIPQARLTVS